MNAKFRLNTRNLFLTYPKCSSSLEEFTDFLKDKLRDNLKGYACCIENH